MRSSTFSSDRSGRAAIFAVLMLLALGFLPRRFQRLGDPAIFWLDKLQATRCCDLVVAGDSRICRGVSPGSIEALLPGTRAVNFGFSGLGFGPRYLDALEQKLDPDSPARAIVLGVTPASLFESSAHDNDFLSRLEDRGVWESCRVRWFHSLLNWCAPFGSGDVRLWLEMLGGSRRPGNQEQYLEDGWVATHCVDSRPDAVLRSYAQLFANEQASPAIIGQLLERVRSWGAQGIAVYAFRPPVDESLRALEDECSGFHEAPFVAEFTAAGGIWLPVLGRYDCFDGSHLDGASARRLSVELAAQLRRRGESGSDSHHVARFQVPRAIVARRTPEPTEIAPPAGNGRAKGKDAD